MSTNPSSGPSPISSQQHADAALSPALRRRLQMCFERGRQLAKEGDFDYAHEMFTECVGKDPSNLVYVEAMMDNLQRKYNNNKRGARFKGFGGRGMLKKAVANKDWPDVLRLGIDFLKTNPWDVPTLRAMASACEALRYNEVELRYLKNALDANSKDVEVNRHCARSLARMGQFDQAIACWHRIEEMKKADEDAPRMISELTVQKARHSGKLVDEFPDESKARSKPAAAKAPVSGENGSTTERQSENAQNQRRQLEDAVTADPTDIGAYLKLASLLIDQRRYAEAESVLARAMAASGNDMKVRQQLEDTQILRARSQLMIAEKQAASQKTEETAELVRGLRSQLNRLELQIFDGRSQRYPGDQSLKFELGVRLKRAGNYAEALKCFQQVRSHPEHQVAATLEAGECLQQTRQYSKALEYYAQAAGQADADTQRKKLALYRAAVLAAGLGEPQRAEQYLAELLQLDSAYRDAAARLDKLRQMKDK